MNLDREVVRLPKTMNLDFDLGATASKTNRTLTIARIGAFVGVFVYITCFSPAVPVLSAAAAGGGQPGAFLQYGVGARAMGMGGAFYAIADDATAAYWNPAGLAYLQQKEITFMSAPLFAGAQLDYKGYAHPTATKGTWSIGMLDLKAGGFEKVDVVFDPVTDEPTSITENGTFADTQSALMFAWGKEATETLAFGLSLKNVSRQLDDSSDSFQTLDVGGIKAMGPNYRLALGVQNVFSQSTGDTDDTFPVIMKIGNSMKMFKKRMTLGFDIQKSQDAPLNWRFGGEYWVSRWFGVRFGILATPTIQETDFGFGIKTRRFLFDYSLGIHSLGQTSRLSVGLRFGRSRADRSEEKVRLIIEQGFEAFKSGDFQLATLRMNQAVDAAPHNKQVKSMLARLQTVVGFIPQALGGEEFQTFVRKGVIAYVDGRDLRSAVNALRYAYNMKPEDESLLKLLNYVEKEAKAGEITRSVKGVTRFTFVDQKLYDARQAIYDGKYDLSIRRIQDVLDLEPNNVTALEIMGSAFFLMEDKAKARAVWNRVLEVDPENKIVAEFIKQTN